MLLLALLGIALAGGLYYLSKKRNVRTPTETTTPIGRPTELAWYEDPYDFPADFTDVYYYPSDQLPPMLQKQQPILPYSQFYGCLPGYEARQWFREGGGVGALGYPGMIAPVTYCQQVAGNIEPDPYADPVFGGNSSAFLQWASYHQIMTNLMANQSNTISPSTVFENRFNIRPVVGGDLQVGGLGRLPIPYIIPIQIS